MIKRISAIGCGLLIVSASLAWLSGYARMAWSILLAGGWLLMNGAIMAGLCRLMCFGPTRRVGWKVGGCLLAKALLYGGGYLAVVAWRPSAVGLAIGVTVGLAALLVGAAQVAHDPPISFGASAESRASAAALGRQADAAHAFDAGPVFHAASAGKRWGDG